jgi:hypothetical protein
MFDKIGQLAEKAATGINVSRRGFLGRLSKAALGAAGMLAFGASIGAARNQVTCCYYYTPYGVGTLCIYSGHCPRSYNDGYWRLLDKKKATDCSYC